MRQPTARTTTRTETRTHNHARPSGTDLALVLVPVAVVAALAAPALVAGGVLGVVASDLLRRAVAGETERSRRELGRSETPA